MEDKNIYKTSSMRIIISVISGILVLIIGGIIAYTQLYPAIRGYGLVQAATPPTPDSKLIHAFPTLTYAVPYPPKELQTLYLRGVGAVLVTIILLFLIMKYARVKEIR